jgi:hypothetical protein
VFAATACVRHPAAADDAACYYLLRIIYLLSIVHYLVFAAAAWVKHPAHDAGHYYFFIIMSSLLRISLFSACGILQVMPLLFIYCLLIVHLTFSVCSGSMGEIFCA